MNANFSRFSNFTQIDKNSSELIFGTGWVKLYSWRQVGDKCRDRSKNVQKSASVKQFNFLRFCLSRSLWRRSFFESARKRSTRVYRGTTGIPCNFLETDCWDDLTILAQNSRCGRVKSKIVSIFYSALLNPCGIFQTCFDLIGIFFWSQRYLAVWSGGIVASGEIVAARQGLQTNGVRDRIFARIQFQLAHISAAAADKPD